MKTYDITYKDLGLFTMFLDNTKEGKIIIDQLFEQSGSNKILTVDAKNIIAKIRKSGYSVGKAKQQTKSSDDILNELGALLLI